MSFDTLIPSARAFLSELSQNNNRDWFQANKPRYEADLKAPAALFLEQINSRLSQQLERPMKTKLFRIHRDVRFSKDKTPYNTYLHMLWTDADTAAAPGWFLGISPDYIRAGWGWMKFSPTQLMAWRDLVDHEADLPAQLAKTGLEVKEPELKRVPPPYDKSHPRGNLLRHKSLSLWRDLAPVHLEDEVMETVGKAMPVHQLLEDRFSGG